MKLCLIPGFYAIQVIVMATDQGIPTPCMAKSNATVVVKVIRNSLPPQFSQNGQYKATISEGLGLNNRVGNVRADDSDRGVSCCPVSQTLGFFSITVNMKEHGWEYHYRKGTENAFAKS